MDTSVMEKVHRLGDSKPTKVLSSGATQWLLAQIGRVSLYVVDNQPGAEFTVAGHPEEAAVIVLEGLLNYEDGRVVRGGEAVFQLPNTPYKGKYVGTESIRLLVVKVMPKSGSASPNPDLMKKVVRIQDVEPFRRPGSGSLQRLLAVTENLSVVHIENRPVTEFLEPGHPEEEIIYVLGGKLEYADGRTVRAGEAICNIPNLPHPARYAGTEPIRSIEIMSPPYEMLPIWGCI